MRWAKRLALGCAAALVLAGVLLLDLSPHTAELPRPAAADVAATRTAYDELRRSRGAGTELDNRALRGLARLVADGWGIDRIGVQVAGGVLEARASIPVAPALWVNLAGRTRGGADGFPAIECEIGRLTMPPAACRWAVERARGLVHRGKGEPPPLGSLVRRLDVRANSIVLAIGSGSDSELLRRLISRQHHPVDRLAVRQAYCALVLRERATPATRLEDVARRAFSGPRPWNAGRARATFVALAVLTAGERAERLLLADPGFPGSACRRLKPSLALHGRADLAQHWALSAGLTAAYGSRAAGNMGEWKELDDSLPAGSGFSFVDLAADRAGVSFARRATEGGEAAAVAAELSEADAATLLPRDLLRAPEGLSEEGFTDRFGALDAKAYRRHVAAIDRRLAQPSR
ncbi:hypothetical protein WAB17_04980 [Parerythrobacter aurantius]|uniref:hypothetical protein n=1 Tax=Parerythrobacter aurantius TaxID=3127706 RepID=UPI00324FAE9D